MLLKKTTLALASIGALASSGTCLAGATAAEPAKAELAMAPQYALSWPQDLGKVDLFVAPVPDQTKMTRVRRDISETAMTLVSPLPGTTRAYFFIKPENGKPGIWVSDRVLPTQGVANFRDMGGYETTDHHHVRWGEFYRSAAPSGLTQNDYAFVDTLGIKSVTDLRTQAEQKKQPTQWQGVSPAFFPSEKPTLTHCTAGKDRTGFASALILYALGVPEQTILSDYAMSGDLLRAHLTPSFKAAMTDHQNGGAMAASPSMRAMLNSDPDYLKAAFASIRKHYGSIDAYLAQKLAVGPQQLAALRSLYLD